MRLIALIGTFLTLTACATVEEKARPFSKANSLMRREIQARISNIPFQHRRELLNNLLWLATRDGEPAIPDLVTALQHQEPKVRSSAAWVLGRLRDRRVVPDLRPLVADENHSVRFEAARSLTLMGDMQHAAMLIEGLDSDRIPVRYNCHMALRDATGRDFQYDHLEEQAGKRRVAVLRWRKWWGEQIQDPFFARNYARQHGLEVSLGALTDQATPVIPAMPMVETGPGTVDRAVPPPVSTGQQTGGGAPEKAETITSPTADPKAVRALPGPTKNTTGKDTGAKTDDGQVEPWIDRVLKKVDAEKVPKVSPGRRTTPKTEALPGTKSGQEKQ